MLIVDAQVHIWGANTPERPWPATGIEPHRPAPFSKDDLLREMDAARVHDSFGPKRVFWGTDFTRLPCTCRQAVTMFTEEISWLTAADKEWIMGRGVCEWLGWNVPQAGTAESKKA